MIYQFINSNAVILKQRKVMYNILLILDLF